MPSDNRPVLIKKIERLLVLGGKQQLKREQAERLMAYQLLAKAGFEDIHLDIWADFEKKQEKYAVLLSLENNLIKVVAIKDLTPAEVFRTLFMSQNLKDLSRRLMPRKCSR